MMMVAVAVVVVVGGSHVCLSCVLLPHTVQEVYAVY